MKAISLSGWGQPHDALQGVVPYAQPVDYAGAAKVAEVWQMLKPYEDSELAIGWSLGGQLLVRAVAEGIIRPKKIVLIATPYQFVRNGACQIGMGERTFSLFKENYRKDSERTLAKSYALIAYRDHRAAQVKEALDDSRTRLPAHDWLLWLEELERVSLHQVSLERMPPTLLIHGEEDTVVEPANSLEFSRRLPSHRLHRMVGCGHAPHWHDPDQVRALIEEHAA